MQQEIRFATFNVLNLAPAGARLYEGLEPTTPAQYEGKLDWLAAQIDLLDADVIGFQEIFSQASLRAALARTRHFRDALHAGFDPDPLAARHTPSVALVSRLPLLAPAQALADYPIGISTGEAGSARFARPLLHAVVGIAPGCAVDVLVVHLKSKLPDYRPGDNPDDPLCYARACLRSLVWRGSEALALHASLHQLAESGRPRLVLGDFNDVAGAVTTQIVLGSGGPEHARMYDAARIARVAPEGARHTMLFEGERAAIDHIVVSGEFNPAIAGAIGQVEAVDYFNAHLEMGIEQASDHGQVRATMSLFGRG